MAVARSKVRGSPHWWERLHQWHNCPGAAITRRCAGNSATGHPRPIRIQKVERWVDPSHLTETGIKIGAVTIDQFEKMLEAIK